MSDTPPSPGSRLETVETTEEHVAAEGSEDAVESSDGMGKSSTLREMLLSTDPQQDLERVNTPWDVENGGRNRIYRGIQKALGATGMPAVVDVLIGAFEELHRLNLDESTDEQDEGNLEDGPTEEEPLI